MNHYLPNANRIVFEALRAGIEHRFEVLEDAVPSVPSGGAKPERSHPTPAAR